MPKNPPDLPQLLASSAATDRVQVQETAFSHDLLGRYICNEWAEVEAQILNRQLSGFDLRKIENVIYDGQ